MLEFIPLHHVIFLNALLSSYELNTLDACWIAVDVWSNSSRCRQESVYLSRTWCLYTWSCLDNLITIRFSINCSTVICSPTVILMLSWEKPLVKPMAPGSIFYHISFQSTFICIFTFPIDIIKIPKNILSYHISSIRSHFRKWPWRDWQPLYCVGCEFLFCLCRCAGLVRSLLLDWYLGSQKLREILMLLCCITLSSSRKTNASSRRSKKDFWRRCRGGLRSSQDIPSTHHKLSSLALHYLPFASLSVY